MPLSEDLKRKNIFSSVPLTVSIIVLTSLVLIQPANGYLDIKQYCRAFDENFQPIICILKNKTNVQPNYPAHPPPNNSHPHPQHPPPPPPPPTQFPILQPHPDYNDYDNDDDDDCSCEVTCFPRIIHQRSLASIGHRHQYYDKEHLPGKSRNKRTTSTSYRCRSCGTECSVSTTRPPSCYCAIPASKSECTCSATCAIFRDDRSYHHFQIQNRNNNDGGDDDANCIMSVTALEDWRLGEERPPYVCECKRSKEAENSSRPDFICICQRIPIFRNYRSGDKKVDGK